MRRQEARLRSFFHLGKETFAGQFTARATTNPTPPRQLEETDRIARSLCNMKTKDGGIDERDEGR
jgi:hypothetical protein